MDSRDPAADGRLDDYGRHEESEHRRTRRTAPWVIVAVIIAGAVTVGAGLIAGLWYVMMIGAMLVLAGLIAAAVLPRVGFSAPISLASEFPAQTDGRRGADDGVPQPPIDTGTTLERDLSSYRTVEEKPTSSLPQDPDTERAKPQYVNLAPDERIRRVGGRDVIEVPDEDVGEGS